MTIQRYNFDFAITTYCQAKCRSCARMDHDKNDGSVSPYMTLEHFDIEVFKKIISTSQYIKDRNGYILFCGELGDPMMHPDIEEFIDVAMFYGGGVQVNTNGGLRQPKWYSYMVNKYKNVGKDLEITFGVDGVDHETNWKYREGVNFERALENMREWFGASGDGHWHYLIFDWNYHQIPDAMTLAYNIGAPIGFKFNNREHGLITEEHKKIALEMLDICEGRVIP